MVMVETVAVWGHAMFIWIPVSVRDRLRVGEQESRECSNGTQLNSEVLSNIMSLYVYVLKIDVFEHLSIVRWISAELRWQQILG
jgi:hypothetical protein